MKAGFRYGQSRFELRALKVLFIYFSLVVIFLELMKKCGRYLQLISWLNQNRYWTTLITVLEMVYMYMCKTKGRGGASKNIMNVTCIRKNKMLYLNSKFEWREKNYSFPRVHWFYIFFTFQLTIETPHNHPCRIVCSLSFFCREDYF